MTPSWTTSARTGRRRRLYWRALEGGWLLARRGGDQLVRTGWKPFWKSPGRSQPNGGGGVDPCRGPSGPAPLITPSSGLPEVAYQAPEHWRRCYVCDKVPRTRCKTFAT